MLPDDVHSVHKQFIEAFASLDAAQVRPILERMFWNRAAARKELADGSLEYTHRVRLMRAPKARKERKQERWRRADWNDGVDPLDPRWTTQD